MRCVMLCSSTEQLGGACGASGGQYKNTQESGAQDCREKAP